MHIIKVGLNYQIAPVEVREKVTFSSDQVKEAMQRLREKYNVLENVILSTCNRTEIFAVVEQADVGIASLQQFIMDTFQLKESDINQYFQNKKDDDAIEHLFSLAVGLDSMVVGETQILGQVRTAFLTAQEVKVTGRLFNELFKRVITFAKRSHKETGIGEHAVSVSYVAVELAKEIYGNVEDKHVVILGAGEMGELTLKNLQGSGVRKISIVNRTLTRAKELAERFNVSAYPIEALVEVLVDADLLISSTGSNELIVCKDSLESMGERSGKPLTFIDIAVPRDIDRSVEELADVFLYDVDDLQTVVDQNLTARKEAADIIESQLVTEVSGYNDWVVMLDTIPLIKALREKSMTIQETTLQSMYRKMPDLTERDMKVLQKHTSSIIHQILQEPIEAVKSLGKNEQSEKDLSLFKHIFGLEVSE